MDCVKLDIKAYVDEGGEEKELHHHFKFECPHPK